MTGKEIKATKLTKLIQRLFVEIVNDLTGRIEELVAEVKELNDSLTWWKDRYNANEKILERYRTDVNGSSKDTTGNNQDS